MTGFVLNFNNSKINQTPTIKLNKKLNYLFGWFENQNKVTNQSSNKFHSSCVVKLLKANSVVHIRVEAKLSHEDDM